MDFDEWFNTLTEEEQEEYFQSLQELDKEWEEYCSLER